MEHKSYPVKIENPRDVSLYDSITVIRCGVDIDKDMVCFVYDVEHIVEDITLNDIETSGADTITVIAETPLHGEVYRYGNHGNYWEQIGTICGYA